MLMLISARSHLWKLRHKHKHKHKHKPTQEKQTGSFFFMLNMLMLMLMSLVFSLAYAYVMLALCLCLCLCASENQPLMISVFVHVLFIHAGRLFLMTHVLIVWRRIDLKVYLIQFIVIRTKPYFRYSWVCLTWAEHCRNTSSSYFSQKKHYKRSRQAHANTPEVKYCIPV